ncbi:MAG TPA: glycogen debranching protein GlgX [Pararhizobium sp.]|nr:glycogen debranching protein GlgX [Pararhizobium sp.]
MAEDEARPLGATVKDGGVEFAVWSKRATSIDVVLFDDDGREETARRALSRGADDIHRVFIEGIGAGIRYGLRAEGSHDPARGLWFDRSKLLVDPYAMALDRPYTADARLGQFGADTADLVPKGIVTALDAITRIEPPRFQPGGLIYELPVKPFTILHPDVPENIRGTIAALAHPAVLAHLKKLHVSAVELMPVAAWIDERHLPPLGLHNGWGYNPVTFFALDPRLAPGGIAELRTAVEALHAEGIGVILDVVFNHTGESDEQGYTLSLRGVDNAAYYRHASDDSGKLVNDTGTGNTLACDRPVVRRMILDAMRHFVRHAGVDGFRFDLAPVLGRDENGFSPQAAVFAEIAADPLLAERIMIAEPWDIGPGGYQLGNFPQPFLEWNDRYRDDLRRFWRGDRSMLGPFVTRLAGSSDIFRKNGERATRSVNFIAAHDGFTLADLTAYRNKHNEANGERNRDGHSENFSWNNGHEGPTDGEAITATRQRDIKALIASLFASRGTIMLTAGDEFGHSQQGNNNAYAQDNPLTWLDWEGRDRELEEHTALWASLRQRFPVVAGPSFLDGQAQDGTERDPDVAWMTPEGRPFTAADWQAPGAGAIGMVLAAPTDAEAGLRRVAILFNRTSESVVFRMPSDEGRIWRRIDQPNDGGETIELQPRSVALVAEMMLPE